MFKVAIIGGGAWGTAIATAIKRKGIDVTVYARRAITSADIVVTTNINFVTDVDAIIAAVPASAIRTVMSLIKPYIHGLKPIISAAKGLEPHTLYRMSDIIRATVQKAIPMAISGPSFACDVMAGLPVTAIIAADKIEDARKMVNSLGSSQFVLHPSHDLIGAELGGALKNVYAIGAGVARGLDLGVSAEAALLSQSFAEMYNIILTAGGLHETLHGFSGLGDFILSTTSSKSRNFSFGMALANNQVFSKLAEGVFTSQAVIDLAKTHSLDVPVATMIADIVYGNKDTRSMLDLIKYTTAN